MWRYYKRYAVLFELAVRSMHDLAAFTMSVMEAQRSFVKLRSPQHADTFSVALSVTQQSQGKAFRPSHKAAEVQCRRQMTFSKSFPAAQLGQQQRQAKKTIAQTAIRPCQHLHPHSPSHFRPKPLQLPSTLFVPFSLLTVIAHLHNAHPPSFVTRQYALHSPLDLGPGIPARTSTIASSPGKRPESPLQASRPGTRSNVQVSASALPDNEVDFLNQPTGSSSSARTDQPDRLDLLDQTPQRLLLPLPPLTPLPTTTLPPFSTLSHRCR
ncbi:hypothetical protein BJ546DRAFT_599636 [Cryomyces antarcticus]